MLVTWFGHVLRLLLLLINFINIPIFLILDFPQYTNCVSAIGQLQNFILKSIYNRDTCLYFPDSIGVMTILGKHLPVYRNVAILHIFTD